MCSVRFLFSTYLGVESHVEWIELSLQFSDLIIFVHQ